MERYFDPRRYELMYMDTDSYYMATTSPLLSDLVKDDLKEEFFRESHRWFPAQSCPEHREAFVKAAAAGEPWVQPGCCAQRERYDQRTAGLFKEEFSGRKCVALCSKTYFCTGDSDKQNKFSCKGLQKPLNPLGVSHYEEALRKAQSGGGQNRGFRSMPDGHVYTYHQDRASLSYFYCKRLVAEDGIHTDPLEA